MTDHALEAPHGLIPSSNGVLAISEPAALEPGEEFGSKKEQKKRKKQQRKAEERERRLALERADAAHPRLDQTPLKEAEKAGPEDPKLAPGLRLEDWLGPVSNRLEAQRSLTAHQASFVVGINCLMLSIAAHAIYSGLDGSQLRWAMIPLALTNVLSLTFAILSAQVRQQATTLDALWALPADGYEQGVAALLLDKHRAWASLSDDLHLLGADLASSRNHLRTAYSVLLGGVAVSAAVFAISVAAGSVTP